MKRQEQDASNWVYQHFFVHAKGNRAIRILCMLVSVITRPPSIESLRLSERTSARLWPIWICVPVVYSPFSINICVYEQIVCSVDELMKGQLQCRGVRQNPYNSAGEQRARWIARAAHNVPFSWLRTVAEFGCICIVPSFDPSHASASKKVVVRWLPQSACNISSTKMARIRAIGFIVTLCAFVASIKCENGVNSQGPSLFCSDLSPQNNIDISQVREIY